MKPKSHTALLEGLVQQMAPHFREREDAARGL
jgi:hypothetical protein